MGRTGFKLGTLFGIEIRLDISVAIIFALVVWSLAASVFPIWHADWGPGRLWSTSIAAGLIFFASLLAHELAHSVVAQARGIRVPRITLFVFGGVSEMSREPDTPKTEFLVAIVGPAMSFALGIAFTWIGLAAAPDSFAETLYSEPEAAMAELDALSTLLLWLGPVNIILAVFNLVPGFPLDGGRVLRSAVWWITGDLERATRTAANGGRIVAWTLMGLGVLQVATGALIQGLWLMLIGWFLYSAARSSHSQLLMRHALERLSIGDLMRTRFEVVEPDVPLRRFVDEYLLRSGQRAWPVVRGGQLVGLVSFEDINTKSDEDLDRLSVADAMHEPSAPIAPSLSGRGALEALLGAEEDPIAVVEGKRIVGLLHRADIMRWLAVHHLETG